VEKADANDALLAWLGSGVDWRRHRAVVFLDPFGMQVSWATIEALARTKSIEVIINFPLAMAIQRLLTKSGQIPPTSRAALDNVFGSPNWAQIVYGESEGLFGPQASKLADAGPRLLEWHRQRLKNVFGHVSTPRLIKNTRGNPLYYLIWAGPNEKGLKGADYILSKGDKVLRAQSRSK
jgi:three-Cys-motif partner protein